MSTPTTTTPVLSVDDAALGPIDWLRVDIVAATTGEIFVTAYNDDEAAFHATRADRRPSLVALAAPAATARRVRDNGDVELELTAPADDVLAGELVAALSAFDPSATYGHDGRS